MALKKRCGDRTVLRVGLTQLLLGLEPSSKAPGGRAAYATEVRTRLRDLADIGHEDESILERLLSKLTETERKSWRIYSFGGRDSTEHYGTWLQFQFESGVDKYAMGEREARDYIHRENSLASIRPSSRRASSRSPPRESRGRVFAVQEVSEQSKGSFKIKKQQSSSQAATGYKTKCSFCSGEHKTFKCSKWLEADVPKRLEMVKESHLCANCLGEGHKAEGCNRFGPCEIDGCTEKHNGKLDPSTAKKPSTGCMALAVGDANGFVVRGHRVTNSCDPGLSASPVQG